MAPREQIHEERWEERSFVSETFADLELGRCSFHRCSFRKCTFRNVRFNNCYIGFGSTYENCCFERCCFTGKYSALSDGRFAQCDFDGFRLQSSSLQGTTFESCRFSGRWQGVFLYPTDAPGGGIMLRDVDLADVQMRNVMFYGADLTSVTLPRSSIRVIPNPAGGFTRALERAAGAAADNEVRYALSALLVPGHDCNPQVFCDDVLDSLLDIPESRRLFESVAKDWIDRPAGAGA